MISFLSKATIQWMELIQSPMWKGDDCRLLIREEFWCREEQATTNVTTIQQGRSGSVYQHSARLAPMSPGFNPRHGLYVEMVFTIIHPWALSQLMYIPEPMGLSQDTARYKLNRWIINSALRGPCWNHITKQNWAYLSHSITHTWHRCATFCRYQVHVNLKQKAGPITGNRERLTKWIINSHLCCN